MNKSTFLDGLINPAQLSEEVVNDFNSIVQRFPFSPLPYFLMARYHYQKNTSEKDRFLQLASAYAPDRKKLKKFVTASDSEISEMFKHFTRANDLKENTTLESFSSELRDEDNAGDEAAKEEIEINEEAPFQSIEHSEAADETVDLEIASKEESSDHKIEVEKVEILNEFEESVITSEIAKPVSTEEVAHQDSNGDSEEEKYVEGFSETSYSHHGNGNGEKETKEVQDLSRKDQDELIERFIKLRPSIIRASLNDNQGKQEDLAEKSLTEEIEIISENLAVIMARQGKTEKAIDIYKKLIWKYPQKKSYFADRIQELKK